MRLRTFTAPSMQAAMSAVRAALGEDAIILSSVSDKAGGVTVTAAMDEREPPPPAPAPSAAALRNIASNAGRDWLDELSSLLRYHNVPEPLAGRLLYKARHLELDKLFALQRFGGEDKTLMETKALSRLLEGSFHFTPLPSGRETARLLLAGPCGIGKTLAIAKLATQWVMDGARVTVITTDTKRAGGVEQLAAFTDILELPLGVAQGPADLQAYLRAAPADHAVLIDTAGANPYDRADLEELTELIAVGGFEPVLTLNAGMDSQEAADTARAYNFPAMKRLLMTRADTARRFGCILAAADARPLGLCHFSDSARVVGELKPLQGERLAQLMLQYRENR